MTKLIDKVISSLMVLAAVTGLVAFSSGIYLLKTGRDYNKTIKPELTINEKTFNNRENIANKLTDYGFLASIGSSLAVMSLSTYEGIKRRRE